MNPIRGALLILSLQSLQISASDRTPESTSQFRIEAKSDTQATDQWTLKFDGKSIGLVESIGGKPQILDLKPLTGTGPAQFWILNYSAGIAGTHSISALDRFLVLAKGPKDLKILLDLPIRLIRYPTKSQPKVFERNVKWKPDLTELALGALDEYPETLYQFRNGQFVEQTPTPGP